MRALLALFLLLTAAAAHADPELPPVTGRVVDAARILSPKFVADLDARLAAHEQATSNQVVVATVPSLQGYDVERFANDLYRAWRLGQANRNNGVLLLVAPHEREVRIEVGYGLEGALTDAISADIVRNRIVPRFKANDIPGGISAAVDAILAAVKGEYEAETKQPKPEDYLPFILILLWFVFLMYRGRRGYGFGPRRRGWYGGPWYGGGWSGGRGGGGGFGGGSGGGFSGGGGSSGGGGASGRW